jgi:hypothetical protein
LISRPPERDLNHHSCIWRREERGGERERERERERGREERRVSEW